MITAAANAREQKWDHAISSLVIRSSIGLSFGVIFSVLLFKRRAWPAWIGLGFGAGRAWEEADGVCSRRKVTLNVGRPDADFLCGVATFKKGGTPMGRDGLRLVRS